VKEAFKTIDGMFAAGLRSRLKLDFNLCNEISSDHDAYTFVANLADVFMSVVQYNSEALLNVNQLCKFMLAPGTAYKNLVRLHRVTNL
jgi:Serine carboxypeptidase S28